MVSLAMNIAAFLFLAWIGLIVLGVVGDLLDTLTETDAGKAIFGCILGAIVLVFVAVTSA